MSGKFLRKLVSFIVGAESFDVINEVRPLVDKYNYRSFTFSTVAFLPFLVILSVSSVFVEKMRWMFWGCVFFTLSMVVLFFLSRIKCVKKNSKLILSFLYIEIIFTLLFAMLISCFGNPEITAIAYFVFLVALPLFICDCPWRLNVIYIFLAVIFIILSHGHKLPKVFIYDMSNCIIYTILGMFVNTGVQISHFEVFSNRCLIKRQRDTDTLTGAFTKKAFEVHAQREMRKENSVGTFMIFDIDNFKNINDTLGHAVGDYFISNTGHLILKNCRQTDIVGRFGGDEFVIYMPCCDSVEVINKKANEFMTLLKSYFSKTMNYDNFSISIGSTIYKDHTKTYEEIFNEMDMALYDAKKSGKNKCCIYKELES